MALGIIQWTPQQQKMLLDAQAKEKPYVAPPTPAKSNAHPQAGDVVAGDSFEYSGDHGFEVTNAARDNPQGFKGRIIQRSNFANPTDPPEYTKDESILSSTDKKQDSQTFFKAFNSEISSTDVSQLKAHTAQLTRLKSEGANHIAVNFSQSFSKADEAQIMSQKMQKDPNFKSNFERAAGIDDAVLNGSQGNDKAAAERAKLNQSLIDHVNQAVDGNQDIKGAKSKYDNAVSSLSANKVSVVVAAGNAGELVDSMATQSGVTPHLSSDFYNNPLSDKNTITVGATGNLGDLGGSCTSDFLNPDGSTKHVDSATPQCFATYGTKNANFNSIYADGAIGSAVGTSFAAPRVAAAVAQLHKDYPNDSNEQILARLKTSYSSNFNLNGQSVPVLDSGKTASLFAGGGNSTNIREY